MSLGFHSFLQSVSLPDWFPLANLEVGQSKVLSLLSMKKDNNGNVIYDENAASSKTEQCQPAPPPEELIPMEPRSCFRVCVVGGGVAGLSCCLEIFRICEQEKIDVEVVLVEGRSRLGGRLWTDRETFTTADGKNFPVDLGASWIHGIDQNPMATLAREAGADFVTTSEDVKMFQAGGEEVDTKKDERAGELFDKLLDFAVSINSLCGFALQALFTIILLCFIIFNRLTTVGPLTIQSKQFERSKRQFDGTHRFWEIPHRILAMLLL